MIADLGAINNGTWNIQLILHMIGDLLFFLRWAGLRNNLLTIALTVGRWSFYNN